MNYTTGVLIQVGQRKNLIIQATAILCALIACNNDYFNSFSPGQNGRHFADDIFTCIFMNKNFDFD